jgi:hypothetical protein
VDAVQILHGAELLLLPVHHNYSMHGGCCCCVRTSGILVRHCSE